MATTRQAIPITSGVGTNIATVLPNANATAGDQQIVSIGDPDNGNQQAAVGAGGALKVDVGTAAAALSDALTNPTTVQIGADLLLWDPTGAQWQRAAVVPSGATGAVYKGVQAVGALTNYAQQVGYQLAGTGITGTTPGTANTITGSQNDTGTKRRFLYINSTCNQAIHLLIRLTSGTGQLEGTMVVVDIPINAGNTNAQRFVITSGGQIANDASSAVNAPTSGALIGLDVPAQLIQIYAYAAVTPASGTLSLSYLPQS